jgi:hypothetical protein
LVASRRSLRREWPFGVLLSRGVCRRLVVALSGAQQSCLWRTTPWGTQWGQMDDRVDGLSLTGVGAVTGRMDHFGARPCLVLTNFYPLLGVESRRLAVSSVSRLPTPGVQDSYLVDSASSHMLVSKIKPCMSKYKHSYCETANGSLNQLSFI